MATRMRLDTLAGEAFLRRDGPRSDEDERLGLVTGGEALARLLQDAHFHRFSYEEADDEAERDEEVRAVEGFLRDCAEFCDVPGLPVALREEMEVYFGQKLDALWRRDWLVFGDAREQVVDPGEPPLSGRVVTLCLARTDSPSVEMDPRLRRSLDRFKTAVARVREDPRGDGPPEDEGGGGLVH